MLYVCIIMYVHFYYPGHMLERLTMSTNIVLSVADLINANIYRHIELLASHHPSVCNAFMFSATVSVAVIVAIPQGLYVTFFTEVIAISKLLAKKVQLYFTII